MWKSMNSHHQVSVSSVKPTHPNLPTLTVHSHQTRSNRTPRLTHMNTAALALTANGTRRSPANSWNQIKHPCFQKGLQSPHFPPRAFIVESCSSSYPLNSVTKPRLRRILMMQHKETLLQKLKCKCKLASVSSTCCKLWVNNMNLLKSLEKL